MSQMIKCTKVLIEFLEKYGAASMRQHSFYFSMLELASTKNCSSFPHLVFMENHAVGVASTNFFLVNF